MRRLTSFKRQKTPKLWGHEELIINKHQHCMKLLYLNPGFQSSLHFHTIKNETFMVLEGLVLLEFIDEDGQLNATYLSAATRDSFTLQAGVAHRFRAVREPALVVEASTPHNDDDVTRLEESRTCGT